MGKKGTSFICQSCGNESSRWMGRCPGCNEWNTLVEEKKVTSPKTGWTSLSTLVKPQPITEVKLETEIRFSSGLPELDRVLGGGVVPGSLGLVGGEPGIGKSTLLMQVAAYVANKHGEVLYVSGEESLTQLKLRASRLNSLTSRVSVVPESDVEVICNYIKHLLPKLVIIDSIQTTFFSQLSSAPGSVGQVRECTNQFLRIAKELEIAVVLVGHVTKGGAFAGPKVLEHAVDYVLYFEGDNHNTFRLLRGVKNRFGATEVGIFDMTNKGLIEVTNPSRLFLDQRPLEISGSVVVPCMEGTRPLLVEIQALAGPSAFGGTPRRQTTGVDYQRFLIILAVLEKRQKYPLQNQDVYVNAAGGFRLDEPAADLAIAVAIASSVRNIAVDPKLAVLGEIGLAGEVRAVNAIEQRLKELHKLGFTKCLIPESNFKGNEIIEVKAVSTVQQSLAIIFGTDCRGGFANDGWEC